MDVRFNAATAVNAFKEVAQSFKSQQGEGGGHTYLTIDFNNPQQARVGVGGKNDAASFKQITDLVITIMNSQEFTPEQKQDILHSFKDITYKFNDKKLNFLTSIFFGSDKKAQIFAATHIIAQTAAQLKEVEKDPSAASDVHQTNYVQTLLKKGENLTGLTENIKNTLTNLMDVITLTIPEGKAVKEFTKELLNEIQAFKTAYDNKAPLPTVQGRTVGEKDIASLANLAKNLQGEDGKDWRRCFRDVVQKKHDAKEGTAFLSISVRAAMEIMKNEEDAKKIGTYLMSECTTFEGVARVIKPNDLNILLTDPRIRDNPLLKNAVIGAAKEVMLEAVRKSQSNIVFAQLRTIPDRNLRDFLLDEWNERAKTLGESDLDLAGVGNIAKQALFEGSNITIDTNDDETDDNKKALGTILTLKNEVDTLISHHQVVEEARE